METSKFDIADYLDNNEMIPNIDFARELHFQYKEKHKGLVFMPQSALKRKVWNGNYYEPALIDSIRNKILRKVRKTIYLILNWEKMVIKKDQIKKQKFFLNPEKNLLLVVLN